jgi:hypothetical protein
MITNHLTKAAFWGGVNYICLVALPTAKARIVFRFIIESSSLMDFGP